MASIIGSAVGELGSLLGPQLLRSLGLGALAGIGSVGAADLIKAIQADLSSGDANRVGQARRVPQYAIVDMHNGKVIRTLSSKHVYSILTHRRRINRRSRPAKLTVLRPGEELVSVR